MMTRRIAGLEHVDEDLAAVPCNVPLLSRRNASSQHGAASARDPPVHARGCRVPVASSVTSATGAARLRARRRAGAEAPLAIPLPAVRRKCGWCRRRRGRRSMPFRPRRRTEVSWVCPLASTSAASAMTAPSTQPPDTEPRKLPSPVDHELAAGRLWRRAPGLNDGRERDAAALGQPVERRFAGWIGPVRSWRSGPDRARRGLAHRYRNPAR